MTTLAKSLFVFLLLVLWSFVCGHKLTKILRIAPRDTLFDSTIAVALGLVGLSSITLGLGLVGFLHWHILALLLLATAALSIGEISTLPVFFRAVRTEWISASRRHPFLARIILSAIVVDSLLSFAGCIAPETGWDAATYHFALPKLFAKECALVVRADILQSFFPLNMEMLYTAGFVLSDEICAALFNLLIFILLIVAVIRLAHELSGNETAFVAVAIFLGLFHFLLESSGGDIEIGQTLYFTICLILLARWARDKTAPDLALCGVFFGFILGVKYTSLIMSVAFLLFLVGAFRTTPANRSSFSAKSILLFALPALALGSVWYVITYAGTGDPLYPWPAVSRIFPGKTDNLSEAIVQYLWAWRYDALVLLFPFALLVKEGRSTIVPLVLTVTCVLLVVMTRSLGSHPENAVRYSMPIMAAGAVLAAAVFHAIARRAPILRAPTIAVILLSIVLSTTGHFQRNFPKLCAILSGKSRDEYLAEKINTYWAITFVNGSPVQGKRVLLIGERGYYFDVDYLSVTDYHSVVDFGHLKSREELLTTFRKMNIAYLIVDRQKYGHTKRILRKLDAGNWLTPDALLERLGERDECALYRINN